MFATKHIALMIYAHILSHIYLNLQSIALNLLAKLKIKSLSMFQYLYNL